MARKILVVDDEKPIADIVKFNLEKEGYSVELAFDGQEAIDKTFSCSPDLILLDIMLPSMDGVQILKEMSTVGVGGGRPVILLTNLGSENVIKDCFNYGADGYLIKSEITPDRIVTEVNTFLGQR